MGKCSMQIPLTRISIFMPSHPQNQKLIALIMILMVPFLVGKLSIVQSKRDRAREGIGQAIISQERTIRTRGGCLTVPLQEQN